MSTSPTDVQPATALEIADRVLSNGLCSPEDLATMVAYLVIQQDALRAEVHEMWEAYQKIRPAVEQMTTELSQGGLMALMPALMAGFRGK